MECLDDHASMKKTAGQSPELTASYFSIFTWHWLQPFVSLGNTKILQAEDLYDLNPREGTKYCEQLWNHAMQKLRQNSNVNTTPSVWKLLWFCFGMEYAKISFLKPLWFIGSIIRVYIMRALVEAVEDNDNLQWWWGALLILGMFSMTILGSLSVHILIASSQKIGMKIRSTVSMVVFNKLLSMKLVSLVGTNSGLMLNLVTNDSQKLLDAALYFNFVWFALIEIGTVSTLVVTEIGVSAIPAVVVVFLTQPLQVLMSQVGARLRMKAVKYTDARVHLTQEVLTGMRIIKYNGWIASFLQQITSIRDDELQRIRRAAFVRASISTLKDSITPLAFLASFGTYLAIHKGNFMPASKAFTTLALLSIIERTFFFAPLGIQMFGEAIVAVRRLQKLLEIDNYHSENNDVSNDLPNVAVTMMNCSFSWEQKVKSMASSGMVKGRVKLHIEAAKTNIVSNSPNLALEEISTANGYSEGSVVLKHINISASKGELIFIHGPVGSGKSSLLLGILGEMQCLKGKAFVLRDIAYVPQQSWILNDTVRNNIVFKYPFDYARYQRIIEACALEHDILQFAGGHDTEIGDKGINLSGGQKARISLARACYSPAPVVLLDDPLAAVDVPTAKHLIEHVLNGILKGRTVILVTHNKRALAICDRVYSMDNGRLHEEEGHKRSKHSGASISSGPPDANDIMSMLHDVDKVDNSNVHNQCNNLSDPSTDLQLATLNSSYDKEKGKSTVKEDTVEGDIKWSTWIAYGKASGGLLFFSIVIFVFVFGQAVRIMVNCWLAIWTDQKYKLKQDIYLAVYASFAVGATVSALIRALLFTHATINAAAKLHSQMAERVLRSPQLFFDQNVTGRILNRFSKDQALVDELLPNTAQQMFENTILGFGNLIFMGILIPWLLLTFPPFLFIFFHFQRKYAVISRELKRLEGVSRSPIYAHFTQTLQGIASVRAYGAQFEMHKVFLSLIDTNHQPYILSIHMSRWLAIRLDFATCVCVTLASALVILLRHSLSPGLAGVILVQSMQVTGYLQSAVRLVAETENCLTSVERIDAYANLPSEANPITLPGIIQKDWPSRGEIEFVKYTMTYRQDLPPILNEISFKINAREKIGILGRTGVGKSSLAAALFRMVENEKCTGDILIDGVNIKLVGLDDLRQRLSIIPQDPIFFRGSLRFNLDPFASYVDKEIYEALSRVHLTKKIQALDKGLDSLIAQNGENFSVGERQLMCLARSLLRRSQIIVMDEATAAVDEETDSLIQATIRTVFHDCTMLSIAHRIETVIDCDRVLVLAAGGQVAEFDSPYTLLTCHDQGLFAKMVKQTGPTCSARLYEAACDAERRRRLRENAHASL